MSESKTVILKEYRQQDGWHVAGIAESLEAGRAWARQVDDAGGHHHARRVRRVRRASEVYLDALSAESAESDEQELLAEARKRMEEIVSESKTAAETTDKCPKCGRLTTGDEQHGTIRRADESGDGLAHDGGCDACCACRDTHRS